MWLDVQNFAAIKPRTAQRKKMNVSIPYFPPLQFDKCAESFSYV